MKKYIKPIKKPASRPVFLIQQIETYLTKPKPPLVLIKKINKPQTFGKQEFTFFSN